MNNVIALPVQRDSYGCWTHPEYDKFCDGRDHIPNSEFSDWIKANGLEWAFELRDESLDFSDDGPFAPELSEWQPEPPAGDGWFIGSIHDTEDGPVCLWFRIVEGGVA